MASAPTHAFSGITYHKYSAQYFFQSDWQCSHINIIETMVSGDREMNPVSMTTIDFKKKFCWPKDWTSDLFSSPVCYCLNYTHSVDWMVFYAAFNSVSVISWWQLTFFMSFLGFTSTRLGLRSVLLNDTPMKITKKIQCGSNSLITSQTLYHWATWDPYTHLDSYITVSTFKYDLQGSIANTSQSFHIIFMYMFTKYCIC